MTRCAHTEAINAHLDQYTANDAKRCEDCGAIIPERYVWCKECDAPEWEDEE